MESWGHDSEEKTHFFPENVDLPVTGLTQTRKVLTEWSINPHSLDNNMLVPEMISKSLPSTANLRILGGENSSFSRNVPSFSPVTPSSLFGGLESNSRISSSPFKSDTQKSSMNDLKLGTLVDWRETEKGNFSNEMSVISSVGSSFPSKRSRTANMNSQSPVCQVLGCNKDLSSSKDYHKRHKVCDAHSKTSKVIVNGIEQRFCQQCSRFHLLAEFDDGKRSCRKRLAGHNERRRKLQLDTHFGKPQKLLHYYQSTSFLGTSLPKRTSFVFPDIQIQPPSSSSFSPQRYDQANNQCRHIELDEEQNSPNLTMPVTTDRQSLPKPFLHLHDVGQQNHSRMFSMENDYTALDTAAPTVKKSSGVTSSSCALSLLSAQSQNLSSCSTGFFLASSTPRSTTTHGAHDQGSTDQNSNKSLGPNILEKFLPSGSYSSGMNSVEVDRVGPGPSMISAGGGGGDSVDFGTHRDGFFQRLNSMNSHFFVSPGDGHMVDLRQLSSHLQRVEEQQRNSVLVKKENCFQTT